MNKRHTITVNDVTHTRLNRAGRFGESYDALIARLLDAAGYPKSTGGGQK